jgi:hypothetical protein
LLPAGFALLIVDLDAKAWQRVVPIAILYFVWSRVIVIENDGAALTKPTHNICGCSEPRSTSLQISD